MNTIEKIFISVLSLALTGSCLQSEHKNQMTSTQSTATPKTASTPKEDLSNWQTILLREKGIKFKLPPNWRHDEPDLESKDEGFTTEALEWNTPNKELIRIYITTYPKGFISLERTAATKKRTAATKEEMVEEELDRAKRNEKSDRSYSEVKKLKVGGVEGVFFCITVGF